MYQVNFENLLFLGVYSKIDVVHVYSALNL